MTLTAQELQQRISNKEISKLIDVREEDEWKICHLPNAILVPLSEFQNHIFDELMPEESAVIYCHHGIRSARAQSFLNSKGYYQVYNLEGGIEAWAQTVDPTMARY